ncbi:hypothetical protein Dda_6817 [Drechslerella dactyloides]|uniref:Uncharacterized protein n=1 Tax=Drechslerella dactyloides TaxID=74499 RepID=A0AAD6IU64_DREDA|nr:hypothetical protein Dda_6817 [Drechslerella dactyloides]
MVVLQRYESPFARNLPASLLQQTLMAFVMAEPRGQFGGDVTLLGDGKFLGFVLQSRLGAATLMI